MERSDLIREYVTALRQKNASIFIGSGMSMPIFKTDWKKLIKPYAKKVKIRIKKDGNNYPLIAQYYVNKGNDENEFKIAIAENFKSRETTEFHKCIARLPIQHYWTTNYDSLIENALELQDKKFDIIYDNDSFADLNDKRDNIIYKCHGDYKYPESIIIIQDDYDKYEIKYHNFVNALSTELASSTILFLGYSCNDPNIKNMLSKLKAINKSQQKHFIITKGKKSIQQKIEIANHERYGINTLLVVDYNDIGSIIMEIEQQYMANQIFISGSAIDYSQFADRDTAQKFIHDLGYELVYSDCSGSNKGHGLKIINGKGLGVDPFLSEGISEAVADCGLDMGEYFLQYPFPKVYYEQYEKELSLEEKYRKYRENMINRCGIAFFLFGNKCNNNGEIVNADGVRKEFDIAVKLKKFVFPIGATGYMAKELANLVLENFEYYNGHMPKIKSILQKLNNEEVTPQEIIDGIKQIIDTIAYRPENK